MKYLHEETNMQYGQTVFEKTFITLLNAIIKISSKCIVFTNDVFIKKSYSNNNFSIQNHHYKYKK